MKTRLVALLGLINKNDEVLISLRKNTNEYNNYWEYPGGKVEARETVDQDGWLLETKERKQARDLLQLPTAVPMATRPAKRAKIGACELKRTGGIPLKAQGPKGLRLALSPGPPPSGVNTGNKRQQKKKRSKGVRKLSKPSTETA